MHCWLLARKSPSPQQRRRKRSEEEGVFSFQYNSQYNSQYNPHTGQKSAITEFRTSWGGLVSRLLLDGIAEVEKPLNPSQPVL
jgi:hypothetical protein